MSDVLEGLDVAEEVPQPEAPEPQVDPTPPTEQPRAKDGSFKAEGKNEAEASAAPKEGKPVAPKEEPKTIPLAAHLEERNKWERQKTEFENNFKALRAEIDSLKNPPKPPPAEPEFEQDPRGYVDHKVSAVLQKLETGQTEVQKRAERAEQEASAARFHQSLASTEQQFVQQNPDYYEALGHLRELRVNELVTLNPELTQEQVFQAIRNEELTLAAQLMRAGRNPHQVAYQLAKARGYTPKAAQKQEAPVLPQVNGPKQLPPDQTLGSGSGTPNSGETFLDDDEAFDRAFNTMFPRKRA